MPKTRKFRSLFLSDIHLGTRDCQADLLIDFLRHHDADTIYLVGDIVDGWRLKRHWNWPQAHNDVVQKLLRKGRKGAKLIYIPGNHDEFLRSYLGVQLGVVELVDRCIHVDAKGRSHLVIHGDQFDMIVKHARVFAYLGDWAYEAAMVLNRWLNRTRRLLGLSYWSISAWAKYRVKTAVNFISSFEETLALEAKRSDADGVVCGHIHHAIITDHHEVSYMNCGDWVESCTALAEDEEGNFELLTWKEIREEQDEAALEEEASVPSGVIPIFPPAKAA
ncbi:MAG: UDP-2,3-diacylglucosamine diphosphatase [Pseudomonadota bacterium]